MSFYNCHFTLLVRAVTSDPDAGTESDGGDDAGFGAAGDHVYLAVTEGTLTNDLPSPQAPSWPCAFEPRRLYCVPDGGSFGDGVAGPDTAVDSYALDVRANGGTDVARVTMGPDCDVHCAERRALSRPRRALVPDQLNRRFLELGNMDCARAVTRREAPVIREAKPRGAKAPVNKTHAADRRPSRLNRPSSRACTPGAGAPRSRPVRPRGARALRSRASRCAGRALDVGRPTREIVASV